MTQTDLGRRVGLTQKQISVLEGGLQLPMAAKLPAMVREVGGTIDWLLTGRGKAPHKRAAAKAPVELETIEEGTAQVEVPARQKNSRRKKKRIQG